MVVLFLKGRSRMRMLLIRMKFHLERAKRRGKMGVWEKNP